MGNSVSYRAECVVNEGKVRFDLSNMHLALPSISRNPTENFLLSFGLAQKTVLVGDFIAFAQSEKPIMARVPVLVEKKKKPKGGRELRKEIVERLAAGMSEELVLEDSEWQIAKRVSTDLGTILVETRVVVDVMGSLKSEKIEGGWFQRKGIVLVGRAEGSLGLHVRARFETHHDRLPWIRMMTGLNSFLLVVGMKGKRAALK
eukprot:TRINITY_DN29747_c0_g1_i1.p1 TRINITY_DN29747_c0_g1~~TRINITY_DN29747_c0_g1_i1.p1  ORF type:complete len:203 (-),score=34.92 TRINITY_DN29747_c0_g1_i1:1609-2217(-)